MKTRRKLTRIARRFSHTSLAFWAYRYRYLAVFSAIGFLSILLEIVLVNRVMPTGWPWLTKATVGFCLGLALSFGLNACLNLRVPRTHLLQTFWRFSLVSVVSFALNMVVVSLVREPLSGYYGPARLVSSAGLFTVAYTLHRLYTFDLGARNFGVAVYASTTERVYRIFQRLGRNCDHVHVDLIDETMAFGAARVDLTKLRIARRLWRGVPLCLHVMSRQPSRWLAATWSEVDWYLFHLDAEEDLMSLIWQCRLRGKKVGIVWHQQMAPSALLPFLPHVDFAMVLGIAEPGRSGQTVSEEALHITSMLDALRSKYGYEVMFDGGVKLVNLSRIRARYVVSASAVLQAAQPIRMAHHLRTGAKYARNQHQQAA